MPALIAQRANERLAFTGDATVPGRLAACKEFVRTEMAALRQRHDAGASGLIICRERAQMIDALLLRLFDHALLTFRQKYGVAPAPVALIALGGYGHLIASWT